MCGIIDEKLELSPPLNTPSPLHYQAFCLAQINYTVMNKFRIKLQTAPLHDERVNEIDDCVGVIGTDDSASRNTKISLRSQAIRTVLLISRIFGLTY